MIVDGKEKASLEAPSVTDEVKDWSLVIARFRKLGFTPLDCNQLIDDVIEGKRQVKEELKKKIEVATGAEIQRYT